MFLLSPTTPMKQIRLIFLYNKQTSYIGHELVSKTETEDEIRFTRSNSLESIADDGHDQDSYWDCRIMPSLQDLHFAIQLGDLRKMEMLLNSTPAININETFRSMTALSLAVLQKNDRMVRILLKHGASVNKLSSDWSQRIETPLVSACRLGLRDIAELLIKKGRADTNITDFYGHSALWVATRERNVEIVRLLIENGANLRYAARWQECPLFLSTKYMGRSGIAKLLIRHGCFLNFKDLDGHTPLYWAIAYQMYDVLKLLIIAGAEITPVLREHLIGRRMSQDLKHDFSMCQWLHTALTTPLPLNVLAVRAVRTALMDRNPRRSLSFAFKRIELPPSLKDNLLLSFVE